MAAGDLTLEVKRITKLNGDGAVKAFCDLAVAEAVLIKGLRVVDGKKGLFVSMPREQGKNGQWYDTIAPLTKEARARLTSIVLEAYQANDKTSVERTPEHTAMSTQHTETRRR